LWPELTVEEAIAELRRTTRERVFETIYYIYVVAYDRLVGVLSLRDLILSAPDKPLSAVMTDNVVRVDPSTDQEQVAATMAKYDLSAIPVVDDQGRLLGVVTIDDVVDVVIQEATEDAQRMGGVSPMADSYLDTSFRVFVGKRITWLVVLFVGELLTASVMDHYQTQLALLIDLVIFVPLIISSGGNSGSQSSALVIRALAVGELKPSDWWTVLQRELGMGIVLGACLGVLGFARAYFGSSRLPPIQMGITVGLAVVAVVTLGTVGGSILPLLIKRVGLDPAVSSTPFVASLVDVFGLALYFSTARVIFAAML
jgi:magnesium transporter